MSQMFLIRDLVFVVPKLGSTLSVGIDSTLKLTYTLMYKLVFKDIKRAAHLLIL